VPQASQYHNPRFFIIHGIFVVQLETERSPVSTLPSWKAHLAMMKADADDIGYDNMEDCRNIVFL
jgi:hypothetical protein